MWAVHAVIQSETSWVLDHTLSVLLRPQGFANTATVTCAATRPLVPSTVTSDDAAGGVVAQGSYLARICHPQPTIPGNYPGIYPLACNTKIDGEETSNGESGTLVRGFGYSRQRDKNNVTSLDKITPRNGTWQTSVIYRLKRRG